MKGRLGKSTHIVATDGEELSNAHGACAACRINEHLVLLQAADCKEQRQKDVQPLKLLRRPDPLCRGDTMAVLQHVSMLHGGSPRQHMNQHRLEISCLSLVPKPSKGSVYSLPMRSACVVRAQRVRSTPNQ